MYETAGEKCSAELESAGLRLEQATLTNMLERPVSALSPQPIAKGPGHVSVPVGPFEIVTVDLQ